MFTTSAVNIPNAMYCCQICVDIKRIGRYREELWIPKHWMCNINTRDSFVRKLYEGGVCLRKGERDLSKTMAKPL